MRMVVNMMIYMMTMMMIVVMVLLDDSSSEYSDISTIVREGIFTRISGPQHMDIITRYATDELWIPSTSEFKSNKAWKNDHFSKNTRYKTFTFSFTFCATPIYLIMEHIACRYENILFKGENVLTPKTLQQVGASLVF